MSILVKTTNASYSIDRENNRWLRISRTHPRMDDGEWVQGGFTLGEVGQSCFAHFVDHPDGALGRHTSRVVSVETIDD